MPRGYITTQVTSDTRRIELLKRRLPERSEEWIEALASRVVTYAREIIVDKDIWETGMLYESIHEEKVGKNSIRVTTGPGQRGRSYGLFQELGFTHNRSGNFIAGRPYMLPALQLALGDEDLDATIGRSMRTVMNEGM